MESETTIELSGGIEFLEDADETSVRKILQAYDVETS